MPAVENLVEQVLALPEEERGELIVRLVRTLEPDDGEDVAAEPWEAAWSDGNRWNDLHDTRAEKLAARERVKRGR